MTIDAHAMLAEVRENLARLNGCKIARFRPKWLPNRPAQGVLELWGKDAPASDWGLY